MLGFAGAGVGSGLASGAGVAESGVTAWSGDGGFGVAVPPPQPTIATANIDASSRINKLFFQFLNKTISPFSIFAITSSRIIWYKYLFYAVSIRTSVLFLI